MDLRLLSAPKMPADKLQAHVLDRLSVIGRPLNLAVHIQDQSLALAEATANRNELIKAFKAETTPRDGAFTNRFFGLKNKDGEIDEIYATTIDAIALHVDSVIYFTVLLCDDLKEHGGNLLAKYKKRLDGKEAPSFTEVDFIPARADNMIPASRVRDLAHGVREAPEAFVARTTRLAHSGAETRLELTQCGHSTHKAKST